MAEAVPEYNIITGRRNTSFPSRNDTMYLSSIPNRKPKLSVGRETNKISDIDKAQPRRFSQMYTRGMPDLYNTQDISGAQPHALHEKKNKPQYALKNDDIEGSQAKPYTFKTTRSVDPNDPVYKLASVDLEPPPPPRFTRDQISVADIEGAGPKPPRIFKPRDNISTHDIEGAQAGWKPRYRRRKGPRRNSLDVTDIVMEGYKSKRSTNPLNPVHTINGMTHKDGPAQKPRAAKRGIGKDFNLHTEDIDGAYPGWKAPHHIDGGFRDRGRKDFRVTNNTADIKGAGADSTHNYIFTKRVTNPLSPSYVGLDGYPYELSPPVTPAYDVNRPPPVVREAMETKRQERQEADELSRSLRLNLSQRESTQTQGGRPPIAPKQAARTEEDPRDAEIRRLREEVASLRKTNLRSSSGDAGGGSRSGRVSSRGASVSRGRTGSRGNSARGSRGQTPSRGVVANSDGTTSVFSESAQRMVLNSRDGRPRTDLPGPSSSRKSQQSARQSARDAADVANLPDSVPNAGSVY